MTGLRVSPDEGTAAASEPAASCAWDWDLAASSDAVGSSAEIVVLVPGSASVTVMGLFAAPSERIAGRSATGAVVSWRASVGVASSS